MRTQPGFTPPPRRTLGATGEALSVIGFGGILVMNETEAHAADLVAEAVDGGINYFDVAPSYGNAEERLGPALGPWRGGVFLACKTERRDAAGAREHLEQSLRNLRTDHFDLYQLHALGDPEKDVEAVFAPGGAMETLVRARDEGLVRFLGFSAHSPAAACRAMERFAFDTILYPVNLACHFHGGFDTEPLEEARKRGMGILALKALARGAWDAPNVLVRREDYPKCWYEPFTRPEEALCGLRFTLGRPGVTSALPPGDERLWRLALDLLPQVSAHPEAAAPPGANTAAPLKPIFAV